MRIIKKILKWIFYLALIPIGYLLISLFLTIITVEKKDKLSNLNKTIYLSTNGVHLNVILLKKDISSDLIKGISHLSNEKYFSFGWGDENFYLNTPTWGDLTFRNGFNAMFINSPTLIHLTRYKKKHNDWVEIKISENEINRLNLYLIHSFKKDSEGKKILLPNKGYTSNDDFYKAIGRYSCFNTCNSWINTGFKESGLKSCYWTPFDFGLINKYD